VEERTDTPARPEVSAYVPVRRPPGRAQSLLRTGPWRPVLLTVLAVGAAAVIVIVARHTLARSLRVLGRLAELSRRMLGKPEDGAAYRAVSFWLVLLGGWITMAFLAHPRARARKMKK
jgi:hypothetical protein